MNQIYAIHLEGKEYLSYEGSSAFLRESYKEGITGSLKIIGGLFLVCILAFALLAVQLLHPYDKMQ